MKQLDQFRSWSGLDRTSGWLNKYTVAVAIFFVWMMFFDKHNMLVQYQLHHKAEMLKEQITTDEENLQLAREQLEMIETRREEYARETHRMHAPDEEIFIVTHK